MRSIPVTEVSLGDLTLITLSDAIQRRLINVHLSIERMLDHLKVPEAKEPANPLVSSPMILVVGAKED